MTRGVDGNKARGPIVDTRMMMMNASGIAFGGGFKLHVPLGGRVGADRYSKSGD
jgi:hypothetical protein